MSRLTLTGKVDLAQLPQATRFHPRRYASCDHCLPALRNLNVLDDYGLLPARS